MLRRVFLYGIGAGLIVGAPMIAMMVAAGGHPLGITGGMIFGYATMLIALSLVFVAVKRHRDIAQGGVIKFLPAFGMGLAISAVAGIFYVAAWELAMALTHSDFASDYARSLIAEQRAHGVSGAALDALIAEMESFKAQYANPLYRLPMTFAEIFPVGALVSLISAALLRNSRFLPARRVA